VVVKLSFCGVCGTDLHGWEGWRRAGAQPNGLGGNGPRNMGHEIAGVVAEIGKDVKKLKVGDRVTVNPYIFCGECFFCQNDYTTHCTNRNVYTNGWAEYVLSHESGAHKIPDSMSLEVASQAEPLAACLHAVDIAQVRSGSVGLVLGAGPMGMMIHALLRHSGLAKTIVSEPSAYRREIAKKMGADVVIDPTTTDLVEAVKAETNGIGVSYAVDAVTRSFTLRQAFDSLHKGGTLVMLGQSPADDQFPFTPIEQKSNGIKFLGASSRGHTFERSLRWLERIDFTPLIDDTQPMEKLNDVFTSMKEGKVGKVLVTA
jgi:threonine dehydrogenase-like Zn-dependent dehydrogenase